MTTVQQIITYNNYAIKCNGDSVSMNMQSEIGYSEKLIDLSRYMTIHTVNSMEHQIQFVMLE